MVNGLATSRRSWFYLLYCSRNLAFGYSIILCAIERSSKFFYRILTVFVCLWLDLSSLLLFLGVVFVDVFYVLGKLLFYVYFLILKTGTDGFSLCFSLTTFGFLWALFFFSTRFYSDFSFLLNSLASWAPKFWFFAVRDIVKTSLKITSWVSLADKVWSNDWLRPFT